MQEDSCSAQNITTLQELKKEAQETYRRPLGWKQVVMLARYDRKSTLLVTSRGEIFKMSQSLAFSFNRFSRENYCFEAEIKACYQMVGSKYRGLVQGKHLLVATSGLHSADLVFYNTDYLEDYLYLDHDGLMLLNFRMDDLVLHVKVPASQSGFMNRLNAANHVSKLKLEILQYKDYAYGLTSDKTPTTNTYALIKQLRELALSCLERQIEEYISCCFEHCYGQKAAKHLLGTFRQIFQRCFQHKF